MRTQRHRSARWTWLLALASLTWGAAGGTAGAAVLAGASGTAGASGAGSASGGGTGPGSGSWTVYHHDPAGSGVVTSVVTVDTSHRAWTSPALDGEIYGEPLVWSGRIYVATENDTVYALSPGTGAVAWSAHLASPVPSGSLPCGDISPAVGITGTPVIDRSRNEIFVVADELLRGKPAHVLVGLSTSSGKREMSQDVDPAGADPAALLQRTGLNLDAGRVVLGFGGNYGDCASYRGRVVAVPETGGAPTDFTVDGGAGESQGAVWMGGAAPAVDSAGHIWVSTGNGSVHSAGHAFDDSDAALELSSSLRLLQFFAPTSWASDNANDLDMSTVPVLLSDGQVLLTGKSRIVYLLNGAHLGSIGGQQAATGQVCGSDIDGGVAVAGTTAYLPCLSGIIAVQAASSPAAVSLAWSSGMGGGPPIVAADLVWTIGQNGTLYGLDPATGKVRQQASIGAVANHFPTPSVGDGLLLAPAANQVVAFTASKSAGSATPTPIPTPRPARPGSQSAAGSGGGVPPAAIGGIIAGGIVVIGAIGWLLRRRRQTGHPH
jgi:outer membrane protein assembly factor BamB